MMLLFYFPLGILILTEGAFLFWRRSFGNNRRGFTRIFKILEADKRGSIFNWIFLTAIILIFVLLFYQSFQQYQSWSQNEVSKYLLPPHRSINYFIFYVLARFFAPYLISLAVAILFLFSAKALNKKYQERFFYPEEPYFGALAIFLVSHPGWIIYIITVILIYLLIQIFTLIYYKLHSLTIERSNAIERSNQLEQRLSLREVRVSMHYVWLPAAIFVIIIINYWLQTLGWWNLLKI